MKADKQYEIIRVPHVSEKSTRQAELPRRQIAFKVSVDANKADIKSAVEAIFNVKVFSVNVMNVRGKTKVFKRISGTRNAWKKAYVCLEQGHDISFFNANGKTE
jgi:large subunit ribosomal protein L23